MTRAIKIDDLKKIDETSIQILRVISLHIGAGDSAYVNYSMIARSLNIDRDVVRAAVNRMIKNGILEKTDGKLSIPDSFILD
jgi:Mn-dependent DtxR family transcriptional regulator